MEKYGEYMFSLIINATLKNLNEAGSFGELSLEDIEEETSEWEKVNFQSFRIRESFPLFPPE